MGRGLSEVQRTALGRALANREAEAGRQRLPDVLASEVLTDRFGWTLHPSFYRDFGDGLRLRVGAVAGFQQFSRGDIGPGPYDSANASVSRALGRLVARGLAVRVRSADARWSGITLTDEGVAVARSLAAPAPGRA